MTDDRLERFIAEAPEALREANSTAGRARGELQNWLVTLSAALLALPAILGGKLDFPRGHLWCWFAAAELSLLLALLVTLAARALFLRRVEANARALLEALDLIKRGKHNEALSLPSVTHWMGSRELYRGIERWLGRLGIVFFVGGVIIMMVVALCRSHVPGYRRLTTG